MICVCEHDEHDWPNMDPTCPVHSRRKTWLEQAVTWLNRIR